MAGISLWVRREWSRRRLGLVGLGLLVALVGGVTLAVAGGARRTATAFERFQQRTNFPLVQVDLRAPESDTAIESADLPTSHELADQVSRVDGVEGVQVFNYIGATPDPESDFFAFALGAARGDAPTSRLISGRLPTADAPDEVLVNETGGREWDVRAGDTLPLHTLAPDQMTTFLRLDLEPARGPTITAKVVGIVRDVEDISDFPEPFFIAGPAFLDRWGDDVVNLTGSSLVKVDPARVDEAVSALDDAIDANYEPSRGVDRDDFARRVADTIDVEVTVLLVFAIAAALAGLLVIGQALSRTMSGSGADQTSLEALGATRRETVVATTAAVLPALVFGVAGSVAVAIALSPLFPRGKAHLAEPDPGVRVDAPVLLLGVAVLALCLVGLAALAAWRTVRRASATGDTRSRRPGAASRLATSFPPVPALGTRFALGRDSRRGPIGGLAGVVGAAVLVGGLVGVATVDRSRDELLTDGHLYGAGWDLELPLYGEQDMTVLAALADDPDVAALATRASLLGNNGEIGLRGGSGTATAEPVAVRSLKGAVPPVVSTGRPPGPGEVIIGKELARRLGTSIGEIVIAEAFNGEVDLQVTGWFVNPGTDDLDLGMLVTPETLDELRRQDCPPDSREYSCRVQLEGAGVVLRDGAAREAAQSRLTEIAPGLVRARPPSIVENLRQVGTTPWFLAGFLVLIGAAGLAHALIVGVRRQRYDLAVVRAMGLRPAQARQVVSWEAFIMGSLGAAIGVVLGLLAGRLVWTRVVEGVGALVEIRVPLIVLVGAPVAAIALALLVSIFTGRRASGLRPATVLRAE